MHSLIVSFSHKNCDITTRELLAIESDDALHIFYKNLLKDDNINEAIILSTCNRVEVILNVNEVINTSNLVFKELNRYSNIDFNELEGRADVYEDNGAIHHLFSVASSLDSLVIGETQITGQLKDAFRFAKNYEYAKLKLTKVINYAFKCAADVRNSTTISKNPVSIASTAISFADDILGELGGTTAVVIGAGEMGELAIKNLIKKGCNIILVNRDIKKAQKLAQDYPQSISVEPFEHIKILINKYKLIFSATSAPYAIVTKNMIETQDFTRYLFDMAVPRDINLNSNDKIKVYSVDDLQIIVNKNRELRAEQASIAYKIIGDHTKKFFDMLGSLEIEPTIKLMHLKAKECIDDELARAIRKGFIPSDMEAIVHKTIQNSLNKFLDHPTKRLRQISQTPTAETIVEAFDFMFKKRV